MPKTYFTLLFFTSFLFFYTACGSSGNSSESNQQISTEADGKKIYKTYCVSCHGADGKLALGGAANLAESTLSQAEAIAVITKGRKLMSAYESILKPEEIEAVAGYIQLFRQ